MQTIPAKGQYCCTVYLSPVILDLVGGAQVWQGLRPIEELMMLVQKIKKKAQKEWLKPLFLHPVLELCNGFSYIHRGLALLPRPPTQCTYCKLFTYLCTTPQDPWGAVLVFGSLWCVVAMLSEDTTQRRQLPG